MIKVGFLGYESNYQGGINYLKNLFYAVKENEHTKIEIITFVGKKDAYQAELYGQYAKVIRTSLLDRYSLLWCINRLSWRILKYPLIVDIFFRFHKIDVLSHSIFSSKKMKAKTIQWIPDFQPIVLSHLWRGNEVETWKKVYTRHIKESDTVILSSNNAFKDFLNLAPEYSDKVNVVHFVSQPSALLRQDNETNVMSKYNLPQNFFYLPNQFWKHKNHKVVFEAVNRLKKSGIDVLLVCSGLLKDFRNNDNSHVDSLLTYIKENKLENQIKILGVIDYFEVLWLMKHSLAVINPSLFEGWSSTVEEAKGIGQRVILSDIDVHKEQKPKYGIFFDKTNSEDLYDILKKILTEKNNFQIDSIGSRNDLKIRTIEFAKSYEKIVLDTVRK